MSGKEFKTIDEQIAILKSRGLSIPDEDSAKSFLLRNNYYRISGYSLTLRSHDVFAKTAEFQNIIDIYRFDHDFRHVLLQYIEIIEVTVKSIYAYEFTKRYGPTGYLDAAHFTDESKHQEIIAKAEKQKESRKDHEAYIKHFVDDLHEDLPLWAYVDLFTISDISFLYKISDQSVQVSVAEALDLKVHGAELLKSFMHSMTIIRNLCAHGSRLYNRLFQQKPFLNKREKRILIKNEKGIIDNAHLFGFILIMRRLLESNDFNSMKNEIKELEEKYPFINMKYYGFPDDWENSCNSLS